MAWEKIRKQHFGTVFSRGVLGLFLLVSGCATAPTTPGGSATFAFNGRDLNGFYSWLRALGHNDPSHVFSVSNGQIRVSGEFNGYLSTQKEFSNYMLNVEFRWGKRNWRDRIGKARDAGIFLHAVGPDGNSEDGNGAYMAAIECQIMDGAIGDFLLIRGRASNGALIAPALRTEVSPVRDADGWFYWNEGGEEKQLTRWGRVNALHKNPSWKDEAGIDKFDSGGGSWISLQIRCEEGAITILRNGKVINHATQVWPRAGKILLQSEGSEIFFRKFEVKPL